MFMMMKKVLEYIQRYPLLSIVLGSLLIRLLYLWLQYPLWWDSHVYIGIGKYIYSSGEIGMWESFRPLLHPLILGFFWKIGFNPIFIGKILDVIYSLLIVFLTYKISDKIFNATTAIVSSLILSLTSLFIMFTGLILSDLPAMVFGLLGIFLVIENDGKKWKLWVAGICLSLSLLTRFPQGIWFAALFVILLLHKEEIATKIKKLSVFTLGFIPPIFPYLLFNYGRYGSALEPFRAGSWIVTTATWVYENGVTYYFTDFFLSLPIFLFFFVYLYYFWKEKLWKVKGHLLLVLVCLLTIIYFLYVPRKEPRYLVTILPFLAILVGFTVVKIYRQLQSKATPWIRPKAFVVICMLMVVIPLPIELNFERAPTFEQELLGAIKENNVTGTILTSDPSLMSYVDLKVVTLDGIEFAPIVYERQQENYQLLFVNECDFICAAGDEECVNTRKELLQLFTTENKEIFKKEEKGCMYRMWVPK